MIEDALLAHPDVTDAAAVGRRTNTLAKYRSRT
jgi:acyl-coenzyme A synthetase/AMP-(fatty) acid ligase